MSKPIKPGLYDNLSMEDYHADPALSRSDLMQLKRNPMKFKVQKNLIKDKSDAFNIGTAGHAAILEPATYWDNIAVAPTSVLGKNGSRNTNKYRDWAADSARIGKTIITQDQSAMVQGMVESVFSNPAHTTAASIFSNRQAIVEQSIFFKDATHGFICKVRPDIRLTHHAKVLTDLKTCQDASQDAFSRDSARYGYDVQAAYYLTGASRATGDDYQDFLFVCVEKEPPFCVAVYRADSEMVNAGRQKIRPLIELYNQCLNSNQWPGYPDQVVDLSLPRWAV